MSDFKDKCGDVLTGGATGAAARGSIGAALGALGIQLPLVLVLQLEELLVVLLVCFQLSRTLFQKGDMNYVL